MLHFRHEQFPIKRKRRSNHFFEKKQPSNEFDWKRVLSMQSSCEVTKSHLYSVVICVFLSVFIFYRYQNIISNSQLSISVNLVKLKFRTVYLNEIRSHRVVVYCVCSRPKTRKLCIFNEETDIS